MSLDIDAMAVGIITASFTLGALSTRSLMSTQSKARRVKEVQMERLRILHNRTRLDCAIDFVHDIENGPRRMYDGFVGKYCYYDASPIRGEVNTLVSEKRFVQSETTLIKSNLPERIANRIKSYAEQVGADTFCFERCRGTPGGGEYIVSFHKLVD